MTRDQDRPADTSDIVVFFPPGAARSGDASCTISADDRPFCRLRLHQDAHLLSIEGLRSEPLATGARSAEQPIVVRISPKVQGSSVRIGLRPSTPFDCLNFPEIGASISSPELALDRIMPNPDGRPRLPRALTADAVRAGAVDHLSSHGGITGWFVDLDAPTDPPEVELRCGDVVLARTIADRPRPPSAPRIAEAPLGRFSFSWADVDRHSLERCANQTPEAPLIVTALGAAIDNVYRPVSARMALTLAGRTISLARRAEPSRLKLAGPKITAVIPNYNYAHFLPQRLGSLFRQVAPMDVILRDDASTDDSIGVAHAAAAAAGRPLQVITSPHNSGSVLHQWRRAALLAQGDYLMIAEADDEAEPELVSTLAEMLDSHPDMAFAFSDSAEIDAEGAVTRASFKEYYAALGDRALERGQVLPADAFLLRFLLPRNLVLNVSAVLWRTAALRAAFERIGSEINQFRAAGAWRVYIEACLAGGAIGYVPTPLNRFRRHAGSVIGRNGRAAHFAEVEAIHALLLDLCGGDPTVTERLAHHRATLRRRWNVPAAIDDQP